MIEQNYSQTMKIDKDKLPHILAIFDQKFRYFPNAIFLLLVAFIVNFKSFISLEKPKLLCKFSVPKNQLRSKSQKNWEPLYVLIFMAKNVLNPAIFI